MEPEYLTYRQAALLLGLKLGTLYSLVAAKRIPHVRLGPRLVRFPLVALREWLDARAVPPIDAS